MAEGVVSVSQAILTGLLTMFLWVTTLSQRANTPIAGVGES